MYTTIEADIENGRIIGPESRKLPAMAHVLITLLPNAATKTPAGEDGLMARLAGAWQGEALVRENQGEYETRSELK